MSAVVAHAEVGIFSDLSPQYQMPLGPKKTPDPFGAHHVAPSLLLPPRLRFRDLLRRRRPVGLSDVVLSSAFPVGVSEVESVDDCTGWSPDSIDVASGVDVA